MVLPCLLCWTCPVCMFWNENVHAHLKKKKKRGKKKVHCLTSLHDFYNLLLPGCNIWLSKNNVSDSSDAKTSSSLILSQNQVETKIWVSGVAESFKSVTWLPLYSHFDCTYTFCMNISPKIKSYDDEYVVTLCFESVSGLADKYLLWNCILFKQV